MCVFIANNQQHTPDVSNFSKTTNDWICCTFRCNFKSFSLIDCWLLSLLYNGQIIIIGKLNLYDCVCVCVWWKERKKWKTIIGTIFVMVKRIFQIRFSFVKKKWKKKLKSNSISLLYIDDDDNIFITYRDDDDDVQWSSMMANGHHFHMEMMMMMMIIISEDNETRQ